MDWSQDGVVCSSRDPVFPAEWLRALEVKAADLPKLEARLREAVSSWSPPLPAPYLVERIPVPDDSVLTCAYSNYPSPCPPPPLDSLVERIPVPGGALLTCVAYALLSRRPSPSSASPGGDGGLLPDEVSCVVAFLQRALCAELHDPRPYFAILGEKATEDNPMMRGICDNPTAGCGAIFLALANVLLRPILLFDDAPTRDAASDTSSHVVNRLTDPGPFFVPSLLASGTFVPFNHHSAGPPEPPLALIRTDATHTRFALLTPRDPGQPQRYPIPPAGLDARVHVHDYIRLDENGKFLIQAIPEPTIPARTDSPHTRAMQDDLLDFSPEYPISCSSTAVPEVAEVLAMLSDTPGDDVPAPPDLDFFSCAALAMATNQLHPLQQPETTAPPTGDIPTAASPQPSLPQPPLPQPQAPSPSEIPPPPPPPAPSFPHDCDEQPHGETSPRQGQRPPPMPREEKKRISEWSGTPLFISRNAHSHEVQNQRHIPLPDFLRLPPRPLARLLQVRVLMELLENFDRYYAPEPSPDMPDAEKKRVLYLLWNVSLGRVAPPPTEAELRELMVRRDPESDDRAKHVVEARHMLALATVLQCAIRLDPPDWKEPTNHQTPLIYCPSEEDRPTRERLLSQEGRLVSPCSHIFCPHPNAAPLLRFAWTDDGEGFKIVPPPGWVPPIAAASTAATSTVEATEGWFDAAVTEATEADRARARADGGGLPDIADISI
ncbi:hypothetical protein PAPYR_9228 [Paratrimastix pyriformis]|uniref:Uncharacterized protein n=1 Tax=Paratrimastix pyriformis TaxID=342808 RepID=A0ABQ8UED0_9EUKA|nr:hypothetical protein PAPYR_9228 [Paratrimastix pyriformis]